MALGATPPQAPRIPGPKWWQANEVSVDKKDITAMCHECGHTRDRHNRNGACQANVDWSDISVRVCTCSQIDHWVKAQIKGLAL
jgi:hypothetical protein